MCEFGFLGGIQPAWLIWPDRRHTGNRPGVPLHASSLKGMTVGTVFALPNHSVPEVIRGHGAEAHQTIPPGLVLKGSSVQACGRGMDGKSVKTSKDGDEDVP